MRSRSDSGEVRLLKEAQNGNAEAFGGLYTLYAVDVFRFLYTQLGNRQDAEDLTVEVFLRAWKSLPDYRYQGISFIAFLLRIARNLVIDCYRSKRPADGDLPDDDQLVHGLVDSDPSDLAADKVEKLELHALLSQLPDDYQNVLTARFLSGLSPEEIAEMMGRSPGAVRVLQFRALRAIRKLMVKVEENDAESNEE